MALHINQAGGSLCRLASIFDISSYLISSLVHAHQNYESILAIQAQFTTKVDFIAPGFVNDGFRPEVGISVGFLGPERERRYKRDNTSLVTVDFF